MRKRALRYLLELGYVLLLTAMLLYQAGAFGGRRNWVLASLGTLALGVALAVVFVLYMRVNDQIRSEGGKHRQRCEGRGLSEREHEVAWLRYRGRTNRQIGEELFIAETTVKKHVSHIYEKMGVCSRKEFRGKV